MCFFKNVVLFLIFIVMLGQAISLTGNGVPPSSPKLDIYANSTEVKIGDTIQISCKLSGYNSSVHRILLYQTKINEDFKVIKSLRTRRGRELTSSLLKVTQFDNQSKILCKADLANNGKSICSPNITITLKNYTDFNTPPMIIADPTLTIITNVSTIWSKINEVVRLECRGENIPGNTSIRWMVYKGGKDNLTYFVGDMFCSKAYQKHTKVTTILHLRLTPEDNNIYVCCVLAYSKPVKSNSIQIKLMDGRVQSSNHQTTQVATTGHPNIRIFPDRSSVVANVNDVIEFQCLVSNLDKQIIYNLSWQQRQYGNSGNPLTDIVKSHTNHQRVLTLKMILQKWDSGSDIFCTLIVDNVDQPYMSKQIKIHVMEVDTAVRSTKDGINWGLLNLSLAVVFALVAVGVISWAYKKFCCKNVESTNTDDIQPEPYSYVEADVIPFYEARALAAANKRVPCNLPFTPSLPPRPEPQYAGEYAYACSMRPGGLSRMPTAPEYDSDYDYAYCTQATMSRAAAH